MITDIIAISNPDPPLQAYFNSNAWDVTSIPNTTIGCVTTEEGAWTRNKEIHIYKAGFSSSFL